MGSGQQSSGAPRVVARLAGGLAQHLGAAAPGDVDWPRVIDGSRRRPLRSVPGRSTDAVELDLGGRRLDAVLKEFDGGDPVDWWYERLRLEAPRTPAAREFEALDRLHAAGLPVPAPLVLLESGPPSGLRPPRPGGPGRSAVLIEAVDVERTLVEALRAAPPAERRRLLEALVALVADFHRRGWYHRDLYLGHLVLERGGRLVLLDLGRARREARPRRRWRVKDLGALLGSTPAEVTRAERLRFLVRWLASVEGGADRAVRRRWARDVVAKARRLMAHRPRHDGSVDAGATAALGGQA